MWRVSGGQLWTDHRGSVGRPSPATSPYSCVSRVSQHLTGLLFPFLPHPPPVSLVLFCSLPRAPYLLQVKEVPRSHCIFEDESVCVCVCVCVFRYTFVLSPHLFTNYCLVKPQTENSTGGSIFSLGSPWLLNSAAHVENITQIFDVFILLTKQNDLDIHKSDRMISVSFSNDREFENCSSLRMGHCFGGVSSTLQTCSWQITTVLSSVLGFTGEQKPLASHGAPVWRHGYRWCLSKKKLGFGRHQKHNAW